MHNKFTRGLAIIATIAILVSGGFGIYHHYFAQDVTTSSSSSSTKSTTTKKLISTKTTTKKTRVQAALRKTADYTKSSETIAYPNLAKLKNFWIKVSVMKNRVYLMDGNKVVYIMYCTAGQVTKKNGKDTTTTPLGTFYIQAERGTSFYNASLGEGANYWVSWKNHGEYLFHTVPTDANGNYKKAEAAKLGKASGSHGCVRLSIPDAKWIYNNVPVGTKVVIALK